MFLAGGDFGGSGKSWPQIAWRLSKSHDNFKVFGFLAAGRAFLTWIRQWSG